MFKKRVYKIFVFFMILVTIINIEVSFETSTGGQFLKFGGEAEAAIGTWTQKATDSAIVARSGFSAVAINNKMYIFGGYIHSGLNDLWEYDPETGAWTLKANGDDSGFINGRADHVAVAINGKMYVFGGNDEDTYYNNVVEYDPETDKWTSKGTGKASKRSNSSAVAINGKMYIFGGEDDNSKTNSLYEYRPNDNDPWKQKKSGATARSNHTAVAINGKMYIYGGTDGKKYLNDLWEYDTTTNIWEQKADGPSASMNHSAVAIDGKMYVFGGSFSNELWEYDPTTNTWMQRTSGATGRSGHTAVVINGKMYVYGGSDSSGKLNDVWECSNSFPKLTVTSPDQNEILSEVSIFIPSITVSDIEGDTLTCKYYIDSDSTEKETVTASNTATDQTVKFSALDISSLSDGSHTFTFEVSDGTADPVSQTVTVSVDRAPPTIVKTTFTSDDSSITISGTATDSVTDTGSLQYRYIVGNNDSGWVSNTSWKASSLSPDTVYSAKIEVKDTAGNVASKEHQVRTKAQIPEISVSNIKGNSIDLSIIDSNSSTTQYQIMANSSYVTATGSLSPSASWITTTSKKITVSGLSPNTQYTFKVKAKNSEGTGTETGYSIQKTGTTLAQPPNNITLEKGINFIKVNWDAVTNAIGYDVEADGKIFDARTTNSYTHSGLLAETSHTYRVRVKNAGGTGAWSSDYISGTTLQNPPEMPTIVGTETTLAAITISWDPVANATGYELEADGEIIDTTLNTTYTDEGLEPGSLHKYRVRAKNAGGPSEWSVYTEISTLPNPPEVPENLKGTPERDSITLTWDSAARAEGYELELDGSISNVGTVLTYVHEGLSTSTAYTYRIRAWNRGGKSEWSSPQTITTWPEIPAAPTNIMATAESEAITVTWYSCPNAESYDLQIDENEIVNSTETSYTDKGLTPGEKHMYRIRAKNMSGDGEWSSFIEISTLPQEETTNGKAADLANIVAVVTNKSVTLSWQAVAADVQYEVEADGVLYDSGKDTVYNDTGLEPSTFHIYRVRTKAEDGNGQWCAVLALSTLPNLPGAPADINAVAADTQIELSWTKEDATGYEVEVDGNVVNAGEVSNYLDDGLNPGTSHTYRVRGKNITGVTAWSESLTKSTTSPVYEVDCIKDGEFDFSLLASNVQDFSDMTFVVEYNTDELDVQDLCDNTAVQDVIESGSIPNTNITVKYTVGRIEFTVNESITPGTTWAGEVTTIVFKSKIDGKTSIQFSIE